MSDSEANQQGSNVIMADDLIGMELAKRGRRHLLCAACDAALPKKDHLLHFFRSPDCLCKLATSRAGDIHDITAMLSAKLRHEPYVYPMSSATRQGAASACAQLAALIDPDGDKPALLELAAKVNRTDAVLRGGRKTPRPVAELAVEAFSSRWTREEAAAGASADDNKSDDGFTMVDDTGEQEGIVRVSRAVGGWPAKQQRTLSANGEPVSRSEARVRGMVAEATERSVEYHVVLGELLAKVVEVADDAGDPGVAMVLQTAYDAVQKRTGAAKASEEAPAAESVPVATALPVAGNDDGRCVEPMAVAVPVPVVASLAGADTGGDSGVRRMEMEGGSAGLELNESDRDSVTIDEFAAECADEAEPWDPEEFAKAAGEGKTTEELTELEATVDELKARLRDAVAEGGKAAEELAELKDSVAELTACLDELTAHVEEHDAAAGAKVAEEAAAQAKAPHEAKAEGVAELEATVAELTARCEQLTVHLEELTAHVEEHDAASGAKAAEEAKATEEAVAEEEGVEETKAEEAKAPEEAKSPEEAKAREEVKAREEAKVNASVPHAHEVMAVAGLNEHRGFYDEITGQFTVECGPGRTAAQAVHFADPNGNPPSFRVAVEAMHRASRAEVMWLHDVDADVDQVYGQLVAVDLDRLVDCTEDGSLCLNQLRAISQRTWDLREHNLVVVGSRSPDMRDAFVELAKFGATLHLSEMRLPRGGHNVSPNRRAVTGNGTHVLDTRITGDPLYCVITLTQSTPNPWVRIGVARYPVLSNQLNAYMFHNVLGFEANTRKIFKNGGCPGPARDEAIKQGDTIGMLVDRSGGGNVAFYVNGNFKYQEPVPWGGDGELYVFINVEKGATLVEFDVPPQRP